MARCDTCPHECTLKPGQRGRCRARYASSEINHKELEAPDRVTCENYGRITSLALDPIEKKPIARYRSGTTVLSLGSYGCNMNCPFCQNASIAQVGADDVRWRTVASAEIVDSAIALADRNCIGIAYTYNEPLVSWEFVRDTGMLAHERNLVNVLVSNGMAQTHVVEAIAPLVDAANIDLKCFTEEGYRSLGGDLDTVKSTIETLAATASCHLEVTTLAVPGLVDERQVDEMAAWLASLDPEIPYHLTRFFPQHRMADAKPTAIRQLYHFAEIARTHLPDVLLGNV